MRRHAAALLTTIAAFVLFCTLPARPALLHACHRPRCRHRFGGVAQPPPCREAPLIDTLKD